MVAVVESGGVGDFINGGMAEVQLYGGIGNSLQREYWLGLSFGIGESKNPRQFRKFLMSDKSSG